MLDDGQATLNNVPPGPIKVSFHVGGIADNRQRRGTVPDTGTFDIFEILKNDLTYTPEVVSAVQSAKQDAVSAAGNAKTSEESAEGYAEDAGTSANAASGYAQEAKGYRDTASTHAQTATDQASVATTKAGEANASANTAGNHASAADTARQGAVTAQGLAETARDEAETTVQTALDAALPTKADKEHEHTTAQVTGLDTALTDANWYKGAVPAGSTMDSLEPGLYSLDTYLKSEGLGLPSGRVGSIEIVQSYQQVRTATALVGETNGNNRGVWTNFRHSTTGAWTGWRRTVLSSSATEPLDPELSKEISRFDVMHWVVGAVNPAASTANISIADGWVGLELSIQVTAEAGAGIVYIPIELRPKMVYLPPGYAGDTGNMYYSNNYFRRGSSVVDFWVRRQWTWYVGKAVTNRITEADLAALPPTTEG